MTSKERFTRMFEHREADRIPIIDSPWAGTIARWKREGMPADADWRDFFDVDKSELIYVDTSPRFEQKVLEETDRYRIVTSPEVTEARLMLTTSGLYKVSVSNDGENYTELYAAKSGENPPSPNTLDITDYAAGGKTVYMKFEMSVQLTGKSAKLIKLRLLTNLTSASLLDKLDKERDPDAMVRAGTENEAALLDENLNVNNFLYENTARCLNPDPDSAIVYKYDTRSDAFFEALGIDKMDVSKLRISMLIANAYKVSISGDGQNWTEVADSNDAGVQSASNQKVLSVALTDAMKDGVVYVKISRSSAYEAGKTHDGLVWNTQFYFN